MIKDDNPKIEEINEKFKTQGYDVQAEENTTESNFFKFHQVNNYQVEVRNIFEGISGNNTQDLVPIEGEWFAMALSITSRK